MTFPPFFLKVLLWGGEEGEVKTKKKAFKKSGEMTRRITQALISMEVFHFLGNLVI